MGYWGAVLSSSSSQALNAGTTWVAYQIVLSDTKTLSKVRLFAASITGTLGVSDLTCDVYTDVNGLPGASSESRNTVTSTPTGAGWVEFTGFTSSLTAGTPYWLVFKNVNGTSTANFPTYQFVTGSGGLPTSPMGTDSFNGATTGGYGWNYSKTTNSGTTWTGPISVGGPRLEYSDGTFDGLPMQSCSRPSSGGTADRVFGTQEVGVAFSLPGHVKYNLRAAWFVVAKTSTPGSLYFKVYNGNSLLGSSAAIPAGNITSSTNGEGYRAYFASPIVLDPVSMSVIRVTMADATTSDANTKGYNGQLYTFDTNTNSLNLKPMNGTLRKTITTNGTVGSPTFTDTNADIMSFALSLDTLGEFTSLSGGGTGGVSKNRIIGGI
jgi:hypothetical protein